MLPQGFPVYLCHHEQLTPLMISGVIMRFTDNCTKCKVLNTHPRGVGGFCGYGLVMGVGALRVWSSC